MPNLDSLVLGSVIFLLVFPILVIEAVLVIEIIRTRRQGDDTLRDIRDILKSLTRSSSHAVSDTPPYFKTNLVEQKELLENIRSALLKMDSNLSRILAEPDTPPAKVSAKSESITDLSPKEKEIIKGSPEEELFRAYNKDKKEFERFYAPIVVEMTNPQDAAGLFPQNVKPEFEERNSGYFWIVEFSNRYYLFPRPGISMYAKNQIKACFEIESTEPNADSAAFAKLQTGATCSKKDKGWVLEKKGKLT